MLAQGFKILLGPNVSFDDVTTTLMSGKADAAWFNALAENIAPSTDDSPFFFYTARGLGARRRVVHRVRHCPDVRARRVLLCALRGDDCCRLAGAGGGGADGRAGAERAGGARAEGDVVEVNRAA